jgi:hypothetical protein
MMDAQMKEGVLIGQIESLLRVRYHLPPLEVRTQYEREFEKFARWCDAQGLQVTPASGGHVAAAYLLDCVFDGAPVTEVEIAAQAIQYAHELARQFLDLAPIRAALAFARHSATDKAA